MANRIKGITIEIEGKTTKLESQLKTLNSKLSSTKSALKDVDTLLNFNPSSTELLTQKQKFLANQVVDLKDKLEQEKDALNQLKQSDSTPEVIAQQEALEREIASTEQYLKDAETELKNFGTVGTAQAKATADEMQALGKKIQDNGEYITNFGEKITGVGKTLTTNVTTPIIAAGAASVYAATDFESAFTKLSTIADTSEVSVVDLKDSIIELSNQTGVSASDISEAAYSAISAGQDTADAVTFVSEANTLAKAGFTDMDTAVDTLTTTLNAYGIETDQVSKISDKLITTQNLGKTTVNELGSSLGKVIPTAAMYNVSLDELSAAYVTTTKNGIATAESTTYINSMLNELGKSGSKSADILSEKTGKTFSELMDSGYTLSEVLQILQDEADSSGKSMADMFGSAEAAKAAATITQHTEDFTDALDQLADSEGTAAKAFELIEKNDPATKFEKIKTQATNLAIEFGEDMLPTVEDLVEQFGEVVKKFSAMDEGQREQIIKWGLVAAAIGPVVTTTGKVVEGFGNIVNGGGKLIESLGKVGEKTSDLIGKMAQSEGAIGTLGGALSNVALGPCALVATGIVAIATSAVVLYTELNKTESHVYNLTDAEEALIAKNAELANSWSDTKSAAEDSATATSSQYDYYQSLADELDTLVAKNGLVKEGEEDRVAFITTTLNDALGTEFELNDNLVTNYQEQKKALDDLIDTKRANAILSAYESAYTEAIQHQNTALVNYKESVEAYNQKKAETAQAEQDAADALAAYNEAVEKGGDASTIEGLYQNAVDLNEALEQQKVELGSLAITTGSARQTYEDYNSTIQNYEGLSSSIISGDTDKINTSLLKLQNGYKDATTGTRAELEQQTLNFQAMYDALFQESLESGSAVTAEQVRAMKQLVEDSEAELAKLPEDMNVVTGEMTSNMQTNMIDMKAKASTGATDVATATTNGLKTGVTGAESAGLQVKGGYLGKINEGISEGSSSGSAVSNGVLGGFRSIMSSANAAGSEAVNEFSAGISGGIGLASNNAGIVANSASTQLKNAYNDAVVAGKNLGEGYAIGIESKTSRVTNAAAGIAISATGRINKTQKSHSPSRLGIQSGEWLGEGYAIGIENKESRVSKASKEMTSGALDALVTTAPSVNLDTAYTSGKTAAGGNYSTNNTVTMGAVNINITAKDSQNANDIANRVDEILQRRYAQARTVFA